VGGGVEGEGDKQNNGEYIYTQYRFNRLHFRLGLFWYRNFN
jgi:hypothetical protein